MTIRMPSNSNIDQTGILAGKGRTLFGAEEAIEHLHEPTPDAKTGDRLELSTVREFKSDFLDISEKVREVQRQETPPEKTPEKTAEKSPPPTNPFGRKSPALQAQEAVIEKALAGEILAFPNSSGAMPVVRVVPVEAKKAADAQANQVFRLTVDGHPFQVTIASGLDSKESLAKLADFVSMVPAHLRPALKSVTLSKTPNPEDAYWAKVYGLDSFSAAATAGGGAITIWNLEANPYNLNEGVFNHEMAHLFGAAYSTSKTRHAEMIPPGWEEAVQADGNRVSTYGSHNANEDFSEAWRYYLEARRTPEKLKEFQEKFPNRSRILEAIYEKTFEGKFKVGMVFPERYEMPKGEGTRLA